MQDFARGAPVENSRSSQLYWGVSCENVAAVHCGLLIGPAVTNIPHEERDGGQQRPGRHIPSSTTAAFCGMTEFKAYVTKAYEKDSLVPR